MPKYGVILLYMDSVKRKFLLNKRNVLAKDLSLFTNYCFLCIFNYLYVI